MLGSDRELVDRHDVAVKMPEVELGSSIVACKHRVIVQDNRVHLMRVVELCTFVLVNDERQEAGALILWSTLVGGSTVTGTISASSQSLPSCILNHILLLRLKNLLRLNTFDSKLSKILDHVVGPGRVLVAFDLGAIVCHQAGLASLIFLRLLFFFELLI